MVITDERPGSAQPRVLSAAVGAMAGLLGGTAAIAAAIVLVPNTVLALVMWLCFG